jgi:hypothetical protein
MSKLNALVLTVLGCAVLAGGCTCPIQRVKNQPPDPVSDAPVIVDAAMQIREWDRSVAHYQNGDTFANPTLFLYEPTWHQPEYFYYFIETPLFIGQTIAMPVVMVMTPPWSSVKYTGVTTEPTFTAMPLLPPSMAMSEPGPVEPAPQPLPDQPPAPMEIAPPVAPTTQP